MDVFESEFVEFLGVDSSVEDEVEGGTQVDFLWRMGLIVVEMSRGDRVQVE